MSIDQLKLKSLIKKMAFVRSDLEYHQAEHERRKEIFFKDVDEHIGNTDYVFDVDKACKNMVDVYKRTPAVELSDVQVQTKEIFKKVAKIAHPDVDRSGEHKNQFIDARTALDSNDWYTMYKIGTDLGIEIGEASSGHILWLEQEISMTEKVIKGITTTFEWIYSNHGANKQQLLTTYCMLTCKIKNE